MDYNLTFPIHKSQVPISVLIVFLAGSLNPPESSISDKVRYDKTVDV